MPWKDQLPGGLGDDKTPGDFDPEALKKGLKVEMEHTDDELLALEITLDHLSEDQDYYDKLATIEDHGESDSAIEPEEDRRFRGKRPGFESYPPPNDNIRLRPERKRTFVDGDELEAFLDEMGAVAVSLYDRGETDLATEIAESVAALLHGGK